MYATDESFAIIDNGSGTIKAGMAGQDAPSSVFSPVVGKHKEDLTKKRICGDEAIAKSGDYNLQYPISAGIVTDWLSMEALWNHTL